MLAGKYLLQANNHRKALEMFLQSPPTADGKNIEMAIDTVGIAKDESLIHILIDFLMGENDGEPKDAKYIFKLYMSLGQYKEAGRTAVIIAREEQTLGNYRTAHDLLLDNLRQLRKVPDCKVPLEMEKMLMLLHSYVLVKILVRIDDHEGAAKMLVRVAKNISKFPARKFCCLLLSFAVPKPNATNKILIQIPYRRRTHSYINGHRMPSRRIKQIRLRIRGNAHATRIP